MPDLEYFALREKISCKVILIKKNSPIFGTYDVIDLDETWLSSDILHSEFGIVGF